MKKIFSLFFLLTTVVVAAQENSGYVKKFKNMLPTISEKRQGQIAKSLAACGLGSYYGFLVNHHLKSGKNSFIESLLYGFCEGTVRLGAFAAIIIIGVIAQEITQANANIIIGLDLGKLLFP